MLFLFKKKSREFFLGPLLRNSVCSQRLLLEALLLVKMIWFLLCTWKLHMSAVFLKQFGAAQQNQGFLHIFTFLRYSSTIWTKGLVLCVWKTVRIQRNARVPGWFQYTRSETREKNNSYNFILLPETLPQQKQQYCHSHIELQKETIYILK